MPRAKDSRATNLLCAGAVEHIIIPHEGEHGCNHVGVERGFGEGDRLSRRAARYEQHQQRHQHHKKGDRAQGKADEEHNGASFLFFRGGCACGAVPGISLFHINIILFRSREVNPPL